MKLQISIGKDAPSKPEQPKPEVKKATPEERLAAQERYLGPFETVYILDTGGERDVIWRTRVLRRVLEEFFSTKGRYLRVPLRFRRLVGMFIGAGGGLLLGSVIWVILLIGRVFPPLLWLPYLLLCILGSMTLGAFLPGLFLGPRIWKSTAAWVLRRVHTENGPYIAPVVYDNYNCDRYQGEIKVEKAADGSTHIELPNALMSNSAHAVYWGVRAKALTKRWIKGASQRMAKLQTAGIVVIAVCALLILFIVGYTQISDRTKRPMTTPTPVPTHRTTGMPNAS